MNVPLEDAQAEMLQEMASPTPVLFLDVSPQLGLTASFSMLNRALARGGASAFAGAPANCAARRAGKFCLCPGSPGGMENYAGSGWRGGVCGGAGRLERGFRLRERSSALGGRTAAGGDPCGERSDGAWRFTRLCGKKALRYRGRSRLSGLMIRLTARGFPSADHRSAGVPRGR